MTGRANVLVVDGHDVVTASQAGPMRRRAELHLVQVLQAGDGRRWAEVGHRGGVAAGFGTAQHEAEAATAALKNYGSGALTDQRLILRLLLLQPY